MSKRAVQRAEHGRGDQPVFEGIPLSRISLVVSDELAGEALAALIVADAIGSAGESKKSSTGKRAKPRRSEFRFVQRRIHH